MTVCHVIFALTTVRTLKFRFYDFVSPNWNDTCAHKMQRQQTNIKININLRPRNLKKKNDTLACCLDRVSWGKGLRAMCNSHETHFAYEQTQTNGNRLFSRNDRTCRSSVWCLRYSQDKHLVHWIFKKKGRVLLSLSIFKL